MTGELRLDPQRAASGSLDLSASGSMMVSLHENSVAEIAALSGPQPWGRDDIGAAFQKQYAPLLAQFTEGFGQISSYVRSLGDAAYKSVQDNMAADARASDSIGHSYQG